MLNIYCPSAYTLKFWDEMFCITWNIWKFQTEHAEFRHNFLYMFIYLGTENSGSRIITYHGFLAVLLLKQSAAYLVCYACVCM